MKYDVVVAGAGPSGCMAAIAAARMGARVLLVDKNAYPGGMNTAAMVCPLMAFYSGSAQIIKGIPQEIIDNLKKRGGTLGHIPDPLGVASSITPIEPAMLRLVYFEMLAKEPLITLLLHSFIYDVEHDGRNITGLQVINKSGKSLYQGKYFIDATGDGDLGFLCKVPYDIGRPADNLSQPMTLMFKLGGVDFPPVIEYMQENPEQFVLSISAKPEDYLAVSGFFDIVKTARNRDDFAIPRDRILFFQGINPGEIFVNTTRILRLSGVSAKDLSVAEVVAYEQVDELLSFFKKYLPGFEHSYLAAIADVTGVRESRRFHCRYTLSMEDIYEERRSESSIAVCAFPIDIHDPAGTDLQWVRRKKDFCYDIPYEVMIPKKMDNLLITGRCIGATHEALASARITPTAMALGQAAGTAAALSLQKKCDFKDLDIRLLQKELRTNGAVVSKADI